MSCSSKHICDFRKWILTNVNTAVVVDNTLCELQIPCVSSGLKLKRHSNTEDRVVAKISRLKYKKDKSRSLERIKCKRTKGFEN